MVCKTKTSKNTHGGRRPGAGRKKGVVAETKRTLAESAREYGQRMLQVLAEIAEDPEQPASARVSAANHVLDRGYGKSVVVEQPPASDPMADLIAEINQRVSAAPIATAHLYEDDDE